MAIATHDTRRAAREEMIDLLTRDFDREPRYLKAKAEADERIREYVSDDHARELLEEATYNATVAAAVAVADAWWASIAHALPGVSEPT